MDRTIMPSLPYDDGMFYKHFGQRLHHNSRYFEKMEEEEPGTDFIGFGRIVPEFLNSLRELVRGVLMQYLYGLEYRETWFLLFSRVLALVEPAISARSLADYINCVRLGRRVHNAC